MLRRGLTLAAVLCLVAGPVFAADPGARAPITAGATVNDVALAWGGGTIAIAAQDPSGRLSVPPAPSAPVWYMYSPDGRSLLQDGDADLAGCDSGTAAFDDCQTHATNVVISQDGTRMVVGSTPDQNNAILTFIRDTSGDDHLVQLASGALTDLAMSDNGQTIVATTAIVGTGNLGRVYLITWPSGAGVPVVSWSDELVVAPTDVALSPDGNSIAVAEGGRHHRYARTSASSQFTDNNFSGIAMDVAIGNAGQRLSVAGSSDGWFILYDDQTGNDRRELRVRDVTSSLDAVAIRVDGTAIALGNAAGDLWVYKIDPVLITVTSLVGKVSLGAGVKEVAFARDGNSVAVAYGNDVAHYAIEPTSLVKLWSATLTASGGDVAIDENGGRVAAANGTKVIVYEAKHKLDVSLPTIPAATPGQTHSVVVAYSNGGNRILSSTVAVTPPAGWTATLDKTSFRLIPDGVATVRVNVTIPASEDPGLKQVILTHSAGAAGTGQTKLDFTVPSLEAWGLAADGPTSLGVQAGGSNVYLVNVTNKGNVDKAPPLSLSTGPSGWTAVMANHEGVLQGGAKRQVTVTLTAPSGAAQLAQGTATVTIQGATGSPLVLTGTVGASFNVDLGGPDAVTAKANATTRLSLTVKNTGNAPDSVSLQFGNLPTGWAVAFPNGALAANILAGSTATVPVDLSLPAGTLGSALEVGFTATSVGDPARGDSHKVLVSQAQESTSESSSTTSKGTKGSPGPQPLLMVGVLAALAILLSRRKA